MEQWLRRLAIGSIVVVWWGALPTKETIQQCKLRTVRFQALQQAVSDHHVSIRKALAILCQAWLFPSFLSIYLLVLLIDQTNVFGVQRYPAFAVRDQGRLLGMTILTGIATVVVDDTIEKHRFHEKIAPIYGWVFVVLSLVLALVGTYIIRNQTEELGVISWVIATVAGRLLVLIGNLLLDEEKTIP